MTNGEKLKEIFPYLESDETDLVRVLNMDNLKSWWNAEYKEPTKNVLAVDCIVDVLGSYTDLDIPYKREIAENILTKLPSVTPQEPQTFKWCTTCKEYDQEKHCCHRWSKVIRNTVEELKQEYIEREVLDKIDEIITDALDKSTDQKECQTLRWVLDKMSEVT